MRSDMKRDCHGDVTRDRGVTSRDTRTCDNRDMSRVSHATTTTPHPTVVVVSQFCGSSLVEQSIHRQGRNARALATNGWESTPCR